MTTGRTAIVLGLLTLIPTAAVEAQQPRVDVPEFAVDPYWPKTLPNDWTFGEFAGIAVDSDDSKPYLQATGSPSLLGGSPTAPGSHRAVGNVV